MITIQLTNLRSLDCFHWHCEGKAYLRSKELNWPVRSPLPARRSSRFTPQDTHHKMTKSIAIQEQWMKVHSTTCGMKCHKECYCITSIRYESTGRIPNTARPRSIFIPGNWIVHHRWLGVLFSLPMPPEIHNRVPSMKSLRLPQQQVFEQCLVDTFL